MKIRVLTEAEAAKIMRSLIAECDRMSFAVAWAGRNEIASLLLRHVTKIEHAVIGTHMYQTAPEVLRDFLGKSSVRYMPPTGRLFHPKVYLFWLPSSVVCVVGSHNLTQAAFEAGNVEVSLSIESTAAEKVFADLVGFVEGAWKRAKPIEDDDFLFSYELQYEANRAKWKALEAFHVVQRPVRRTTVSPLKLSWTTFVRGVKKDQHHSAQGRLAILEAARNLFVQNKSFDRMDRFTRKAIAGTYGSKEPQLGGYDWGWFGTMSGQGDFKNLVNTSPIGLSRAIGEIPLRGDIREQQYTRFVKHFNAAFANKAHRGGVATASRLLAMKRPDFFVAVNNANRNQLCAALGAAPSTLTLANYWQSVVVPITVSVWWNHPRPTHPLEGRIWDNRAALLDSHFYQPL